jgi:hypothetical protein
MMPPGRDGEDFSMLLRAPVTHVFCCALLVLLGAQTARAFELISAEEARKPDDPTESKGISRGPLITPISPAPSAGTIKSPFNWRVKFEAFGGAHIDKDSIVVTYRKSPAIDLTQRMQPYLEPTGIALDGVEVPPGDHRIRIVVKDSNGRRGWAEFTIRVSQ